MEMTQYSIVMEGPDTFPQVVYHLWLRRDETNVVGKVKEDGDENGHSKVTNVDTDVDRERTTNWCGSGANDKMPRVGVS
jgi:hypothetical protein